VRWENRATLQEKPHSLPVPAGELVRPKVDVVLAGSASGALAAENVTQTISVVTVAPGAPVASELAASLARAGGGSVPAGRPQRLEVAGDLRGGPGKRRMTPARALPWRPRVEWRMGSARALGSVTGEKGEVA